jgi:hypothetical protein
MFVSYSLKGLARQNYRVSGEIFIVGDETGVRARIVEADQITVNALKPI